MTTIRINLTTLQAQACQEAAARRAEDTSTSEQYRAHWRGLSFTAGHQTIDATDADHLAADLSYRCTLLRGGPEFLPRIASLRAVVRKLRLELAVLELQS